MRAIIACRHAKSAGCFSAIAINGRSDRARRTGPARHALALQGRRSPEVAMKVIGVFVLFVFVLDAIAIAICGVVEGYSKFGSLITFLVMYACNFVIAWKAALYVTEHYLISETRQDTHGDVEMARSPRLAVNRRTE
jgi:hypothetical protein